MRVAGKTELLRSQNEAAAINPWVRTVGHIDTWETNDSNALAETPILSIRSNLTSLSFSEHHTLRESTTTAAFLQEEHMLRRVGTLGRKEWIAWTFKPVQDSSIVTSVGLGALASGIVLVGAPSVGLVATTVLPAPRVARLANPGQLMVVTTPFSEEGVITLLTPGLFGRTLGLIGEMGKADEERPGRLVDAMDAIDDLKDWLHRSRDDVASIAGYSPRAAQYWHAGTVPRPSTVRHLFEVHSFVGAMVRALGRVGARQWLEAPTSKGVPRVESLRDSEGVRAAIRESSHLLYTGPVVERPEPESRDIDRLEEQPPAFDSAMRTGQARRPRRPTGNRQ